MGPGGGGGGGGGAWWWWWCTLRRMSEEFVGVMGCMRSNVGDLSQSNAGALGRWILVKVMPVVWSLGNAGLPPQHREVSLATISLIVMHLHHLGSPSASPSSSLASSAYYKQIIISTTAWMGSSLIYI